jgi:hypothetical protein
MIRLREAISMAENTVNIHLAKYMHLVMAGNCGYFEEAYSASIQQYYSKTAKSIEKKKRLASWRQRMSENLKIAEPSAK